MQFGSTDPASEMLIPLGVLLHERQEFGMNSGKCRGQASLLALGHQLAKLGTAVQRLVSGAGGGCTRAECNEAAVGRAA